MSRQLASITALARAGATELAWRRLDAIGPEAAAGSAALALRGRLLKDRALGASEPAERRRLCEQSADAYAAAAAAPDCGSQTYPLINAATLSLLAGDAPRARIIARRVLELLAASPAGETPYYREATRAEVLLLLGRTREAEASFAAAIALAPRAWEDHASTLRQFNLILSALGEDRGWLDRHRPPRSVHFAGSMRLEGAPAPLLAQVDRLIGQEAIGFGYGALAAGADILIAERLVAAGAELHVVLPVGAAQFAERSVAPMGPGWTKRYDRLLEAAVSVREGEPSPDDALAAAIALADEVAMGAAAMNAHVLQSEAVQILATALEGSGGHNTARVAGIWLSAGRRQFALPIAEATVASRFAELERGPYRLAGVVTVTLGHEEAALDEIAAVAARQLPALARALAAPEARGNVRCAGDFLTFASATATEAATTALAIARALEGCGPFRVAGHFGLVHEVADPWSDHALLLGRHARVIRRLLNVTPEGAAYVTGDLAAALYACDASIHTEFMGELPGEPGPQPTQIYALRR